MRPLLPALLLLLTTSACDDADTVSKDAASSEDDKAAAQDDATPKAKAKPKDGAKPSAGLIPPGDVKSPCDQVSAAFVAETFGWKRATEGQPAQMYEGRMKGCTFNAAEGGMGSFAITVTASDARTIEKGYVERAFQTDLTKEDDRITFKEVTPTLGDQTLFSHGKRGPSNLYQLRWRNGNVKDHLLAFRAREEWDLADVEAKLRAVAAKL